MRKDTLHRNNKALMVISILYGACCSANGNILACAGQDMVQHILKSETHPSLLKHGGTIGRGSEWQQAPEGNAEIAGDAVVHDLTQQGPLTMLQCKGKINLELGTWPQIRHLVDRRTGYANPRSPARQSSSRILLGATAVDIRESCKSTHSWKLQSSRITEPYPEKLGTRCRGQSAGPVCDSSWAPPWLPPRSIFFTTMSFAAMSAAEIARERTGRTCCPRSGQASALDYP